MAPYIPDYAPDMSSVALALRTAQTIATNTYENPAITSDQMHNSLFEAHGSTGTVIVQGLITGVEYNQALVGDKLYDAVDMMWRSDGEAAALLNVLTLPLLSAEKTIENASESPDDVRIAQFVQDALFGGMEHPFSQTDEYVTRCYLRDGFALLEKVYVKGDDGMVRLRKLAERPAKTVFRWYPDDDDNLDRIQQRVWRTQPDGMNGYYHYPMLEASRLVLFTHQREGNNFAGVSVYRPAYKHWFLKSNLEQFQVLQAQRHALGVPKFNEPQGPVQKSDRDAAVRVGAALNAHQNAVLTLPYGWQFDFATPGTLLDLTPMIEYHSLQMVRSVMAQFLNLDRGGSYALSMDISSFFVQSENARATYLEEAWTEQVIKPLVDINFRGVKRYPSMRYGRLEGRQIDRYMQGLGRVLPWLTKNADTENAVRELLQLPDLPPEATPAGGGSLTVETSGMGKSADPEHAQEEVGKAQQQGQQQPADVTSAAPEGSADLARREDLPDWLRAEVAVLLAQPHPGLDERTYADLVWREVARMQEVAA